MAEEINTKLKGLPPVFTPAATLLLLGSMPGADSLSAMQYYAHKQNHFWPLLFTVLQEACPESYEQKISRLHARGIALWDSIHACYRKGSLDQAIKEEEPNDILAFVQQLPSLRAVAFNGLTAQKIYEAHFKRLPQLAYALLPSSSPVPRRDIRRMEDKLPAWLGLREYVN